MGDGRQTTISAEGRQAAIGDAMFALTELVGPEVLTPDLAHWVAQVAVDAATPALERDWRERDRELIERMTAGLQQAADQLAAARHGGPFPI